MTSPSERAFSLFRRGELRDECLAQFRIGLRKLTNPETGQPFSEDEIARATQRGSRWWIQADADDTSICQPMQARAAWFADQIRPERAASAFLYDFHAKLWGMTPLPASGGSGNVLAKAVPNTVFVGSTTVPDTNAHTARDLATGLQFQVLTTTTTPSTGAVTLTIVGVDTGEQTNIPAGSRLRWESPPLGAEPEATTAADFTGGLPPETAAEFQSRIAGRIRHKPASGNPSQFRSWARDISNNILDAYVYPCAMEAGSVLVCIAQKRTPGVTSPNGLVADTFPLSIVRAYLTPPGSPVVPRQAFVVVTSFTPQPSNVTLGLTMAKGDEFGWADKAPWPSSACVVTTVTNTTHFRASCAVAPTAGTVPSVMRWRTSASQFDELRIASVVSAGSGLYDITLQTAPSSAVQVGDVLSPLVARHALIADALRDYFDTLGPGELVSESSARYDRSKRFPSQDEAASSRAGVGVLSLLEESMGPSLVNATVAYSDDTPNEPVNIILGPRKLTLGTVGCYPI